MTYENELEPSGHEGVAITRLPHGPKGPRYKVLIASSDCEWDEIYGSLEEVRAFFKGIEAAQTMKRWLGPITIPENRILRGYAPANENVP